MKNQNTSSKFDKDLIKKIIVAVVIIVLVAIGTFALINFINQQRREYEIEEISEFKYFIIKDEGKVGIIDTNGNQIIAPEYNSIKIPNPQKPVFICTYNYNYETGEYDTKILNSNNEEIFTEYEEVTCIALKNLITEVPYEKSVLKYKKDGKYGLIDFDGKVIVKPIYDEIDNFLYKEGELLVKKEDKYGVINIKGTVLIDVKYDSVSGDGYYCEDSKYKKDGYIVSLKTEDGYRYGYIDYTGKQLLKIEYNNIYRINNIDNAEDIYLVAEKNGQAGLMKNEKQILNHQYQSMEYDDQNELLILEKNKKYGVSRLNGNSVLGIDYSTITLEGIYIYTEKDKQTYIYDLNGNKQKEIIYKNIIKVDDTDYSITVDNNGKYGLINKDGKIIVTNKYYYLEHLYDDYYISVGDLGKSGIINNKDDVIVPINYDVIQRVPNSSLIEALDTETKNLEIYDKTMVKVASMQNAELEATGEYLKIYSDTDTIFVSLDGKIQKNTELFTNNKLFAIKQNDKWGFADKDGNIKVECKYDKVTELNKYGFAAIKLNNTWGVINQDGKVIVEPVYTIDEQSGEPSFIGKYYKVVTGYSEEYYTEEVITEE